MAAVEKRGVNGGKKKKIIEIQNKKRGYGRAIRDRSMKKVHSSPSTDTYSPTD